MTDMTNFSDAEIQAEHNRRQKVKDDAYRAEYNRRQKAKDDKCENEAREKIRVALDLVVPLTEDEFSDVCCAIQEYWEATS